MADNSGWLFARQRGRSSPRNTASSATPSLSSVSAPTRACLRGRLRAFFLHKLCFRRHVPAEQPCFYPDHPTLIGSQSFKELPKSRDDHANNNDNSNNNNINLTMGLLKKKTEDGDDSNRLALFGNRSKSKSPAPPAHNPYAQPNVPPDPYTRAKMNAGIVPPSQGPPPPAQSNGPNGYSRPPQPYGQNPYGAQPPQNGGGYGGAGFNAPPPGPQQPAGYGPNRFGNNQGYGAATQGGNPYATNQPPGTSRSGGYGGLGPAAGDEYAPDANRDALFGGAKQRLEQKQTSGPPGYEYNSGEGNQSDERSYGAYGDRQLTAEEEEEEDIQAMKQEIKFMKKQDVASTRNALQIAAMAEETGRNTLARLGAQGERIHNTERNLDIGSNALDISEDKAKELKKLNRSMFAVHFNKPFSSNEREERRAQKDEEDHQRRREQREATRAAAFQSNARMNKNFADIDKAGQTGRTKASLAERGRFQFEADSDDDRDENEIDDNLTQLSFATSRLHTVATAMGTEADAQNTHLLKIQDKSDRLDDRFHVQTEKLKRIK